MKAFDKWWDENEWGDCRVSAEAGWKAALECIKDRINAYNSDADNFIRIADFMIEELNS